MSEINVVEHMCSTVKKATTAIVLTHNIDFLFVESILLPRLRNIGHPQLTIFADAACASNSFQAQEPLIARLGTRYRVVPVDLGGARRFHPKAIFFSGPEAAALAVGSGNTTHGGWSANHEIWTDFGFPGPGGAEIAAFRDYLERILTYVPDPDEIRKDTVASFTSIANAWNTDLPTPAGLAWTPNPVSMLEQIAGYAQGAIRTIDVVSPYFDREGEALKQLSALASGEVRVLLQPKRAGLSQHNASELPGSIRLQTIEDARVDHRHKFIHAKAYLVRSDEGVIVATGSANCSQAALLAGEMWGNAELMSVARVTNDEAKNILEGFLVTDAPPELPPNHPSDEWEIGTQDLRILSARKDGTHLQVSFKSSVEVSHLYVNSESAGPFEARSLTSDRATFFTEGQFSSITLRAIRTDGSESISPPSWVDDERALRMAGPERQIREKLDDAAARGSWSGSGLIEILELFDLHVQRPVATGSSQPRDQKEQIAEPVYFSESDIYSNGFGRPPALFNPILPMGFSETDTLALFLSFFQTKQESVRRPYTAPPQSAEETEGENIEPEASQKDNDETYRAAMGAKIMRALNKIETAIAKPDFVSSRPPSRLASDIAFISLLMTKSRILKYLSASQFREQTLRFWRILFFGPRKSSGTIPTFIESLAEDERKIFISEIVSPQLTAAMALWGMIEWDEADTGARHFRLAAATLASRHRWLSEGSEESAIVEELYKIAAKLLPDSDRARLFDLWVDWVRDGHALTDAVSKLGEFSQQALAALCGRDKLEQGEVVWQTNHGFCTLTSTVQKSFHKNAELVRIDDGDRLPVRSAFIAPMIDIFRSDIGFSDPTKQRCFEIINAIRI